MVTYRKGYVLASKGLLQALQAGPYFEILLFATSAYAAACPSLIIVLSEINFHELAGDLPT